MPFLSEGQTLTVPRAFAWLKIKVLSVNYQGKKTEGTAILSITFNRGVIIEGSFLGQFAPANREPRLDDWGKGVEFAIDCSNFSMEPPGQPGKRRPRRLLMILMSNSLEPENDSHSSPKLSALGEVHEGVLTICFLGMSAEGLIYNIEAP